MAAFVVQRVSGTATMLAPPLQLRRFGRIDVLLNNAGSPPGFNSVGVDLQAGARAAVEHLIEDSQARELYLGKDFKI